MLNKNLTFVSLFLVGALASLPGCSFWFDFDNPMEDIEANSVIGRAVMQSTDGTYNPVPGCRAAIRFTPLTDLSGPTGKFVIKSVPAGEHEVLVMCDPGKDGEFELRLRRPGVRLSEGDSIDLGDLVVERTGVITGAVTMGGSPVGSDVKIVLEDHDTGVPTGLSTQTNREGRYRFDFVIPGSYTVFAAGPDAVGMRLPVEVKQADEVSADVELHEPSSRGMLTGRALLWDKIGDNTAHGKLRVGLVNRDGSEVSSEITASDGSYTLYEVPPGVYTVRVTHPEGAYSPAFAEVAVKPLENENEDPDRAPVLYLMPEDGNDCDGDGVADDEDEDDDNDGVSDVDDAFDCDSSEWLDTDGDSIGNNADPDDDNDGKLDWEDSCPLVAAQTANGCPSEGETVVEEQPGEAEAEAVQESGAEVFPELEPEQELFAEGEADAELDLTEPDSEFVVEKESVQGCSLDEAMRCNGEKQVQICSQGYWVTTETCPGTMICIEAGTYEAYCIPGLEQDAGTESEADAGELFEESMCADDKLENNDDMATATATTSNGWYESGLTLVPGDSDYYKIDVCNGGMLDVYIDYDFKGDSMSAVLLDDQGTELARGTLVNNEYFGLSWTSDRDGVVFLKLDYVFGNPCMTYGINVYFMDYDCSGQSSCFDGELNGQETDVDCGGPECGPQGLLCDDNANCIGDDDCKSHVCIGGICQQRFDTSFAISQVFRDVSGSFRPYDNFCVSQPVAYPPTTDPAQSFVMGCGTLGELKVSIDTNYMAPVGNVTSIALNETYATGQAIPLNLLMVHGLPDGAVYPSLVSEEWSQLNTTDYMTIGSAANPPIYNVKIDRFYRVSGKSMGADPDFTALAGQYMGYVEFAWYEAASTPFMALGWIMFDLDTGGVINNLNIYSGMDGTSTLSALGGYGKVNGTDSTMSVDTFETVSLPNGTQAVDTLLYGSIFQGGLIGGVFGFDDNNDADTDVVIGSFLSWRETCGDGSMNNTETDVDCGGVCAWAVNKKCGENQGCFVEEDCLSGYGCVNNKCLPQ